MNRFFIVAAMLMTTPVLASIQDDIYEAAQDIQDLVYDANVSNSQLREAERLLIQVKDLLRGGNQPGDAHAQYVCDGSNYLKISLITSSGQSYNQSQFVGDASLCQQQASTLASTHGEVIDFSIIGVCDSGGYHRAYRLSGGGIDALERRYLGNTCAAQTTAINQQAAGAIRGTTVQYLCDGNGYLYIDAYGRTGSVASERAYLGSNTSCTQQVRPMIDAHTLVGRFDIVAFCDGNSYLNRYGIKNPAAVEDLDRTYMGSATACAEHALDINEFIVDGKSGTIVNYLCDQNGYLNLLTNTPAASQDERFYMGNYANCRAETEPLSEFHQLVEAMDLIVLCDSNGYMTKYRLNGTAGIEEVDRYYIGSFADCSAQAEPINKRRVGPQHDGIAQYLCDASGYMSLSNLGRNGLYNDERKYIGSPAQCREQTQQLTRSRMFYERSALVAICDGSGYLTKVLLSGDGSLDTLQRDYIGNYANCLSQAGTINEHLLP